jgi:N-acetylglucosamine-6-sulfatase
MQYMKLVLLKLIIMIISAGVSEAQQKNVIFIFTDDHRYDYMSFHPDSPDFLQTPGMDRMAAEGAHLSNAFVTTSLCSPSRASILTGKYAFRHGAVDNYNPMREGMTFFAEQLQDAGYHTGFFGKWHIGHDHDDPKPGFHKWISFRGQGVYYNPVLNIDGERQQVDGYITDLLTDYALEWLDEDWEEDRPFFMFISHKAVHAQFEPAERHVGMYSDVEITMPASMENIERNYEGKPDWVQAQRYSWHGVEHMYHGRPDHPRNIEEIIIRYSESLMAVDESIDRVLDTLNEKGLADETIVIYMGDNGFVLGEHGLIDKRHAYETSMRVPMLAWAPGLIEAGSTIEENILNIDLAPTFLDIGNTSMPAGQVVDGESFLPLLGGERIEDWRTEFFYQYYWEHAFPQTPTTFAVRGDRYKYIYYHGIWDKSEFYDLETDPHEMHNLINVPNYQDRILEMRTKLFDFLEGNNAINVQFQRPPAQRLDERLIRN